MLSKMKAVLLLVLLLHDTLASPTIEDNKIPTDQEVLGQPEVVASLGLPSDEESFNRLSVFFNPAKPSAQVGSGTYHFVSSTFPEVDARGFHESVFDGIGDYFPSWPAPYKRQDNYPFSPTLAQRLGLHPHNKFRKRSDPWAEQASLRRKRVVLVGNVSQEFEVKNSYPNKRLAKREALEEDDLNEKGKIEKNKSSENLPDNRLLTKRFSPRYQRGMEMGSSGFHGDVFNGDFGDFTTMKKRLKGSMGFHGDTFSDGFGDFATMKRSSKEEELLLKLKDYMDKLSGKYDSDHYSDELDEIDVLKKRKPEMTSMGFHGDTFSGGFGDFYPIKKRRPEMDSLGFHGDTFSRGFGEFEPFKKRRPSQGSMGFHGDTFSQGFGDFDTYKKRRPEMDSSGFHGDTFSRGFGEFEPFKKRRASAGSMGFHGDTFSQGFGDFDTYKKRRPSSGSMGFHGDTFSQGFGDFDTYKRSQEMNSRGLQDETNGYRESATFEKRRPAAGSMGFHGDTFSQGFGDFDTFKKRRPEMDSTGFHGDTFSRGFGEFEPFKKRRPAQGSMGFHGDTFSQGFGDFNTYKKRRPEMDSMGFHGDTFNRGFGDFDVYKKERPPVEDQGRVINKVSGKGRTKDKNFYSDFSSQRHQDTH